MRYGCPRLSHDYPPPRLSSTTILGVHDYPHDYPLTAKAYSPVRGEGQYIVDDSIYTERNFGVIRISGPAERRRLQMILHDANGREVWSTRIDAEELQ